ncbi:MAG: ATP--guanido phosphotransferase [Ruminococcaceae bacterium]|nr:ATP--guanido phosphotransferase [Oscillospiraceae bacterium]
MINDVILRSRVRIARNIKDYPFPPVLNDACRKEIIEKASACALTHGFNIVEDISNSAYALSLYEKNLISREFATDKELHALLANKTNETYIMVCEEDHLRIQSFANGLDLETAGKNALECEHILSSKINFAFDSELGYLTRCPTNLGTAMRASVMMFLPALTLLNRMGELKSQLEKIGMTIRGMYGEGSAADAYIYQISNRLSLGHSEEDLLLKTETVAKQIAADETAARSTLFESNKDKLTDKIMRSYGVLKYAHIISSKEFLDAFAYVRLGILLGIIDGCENFDSLLHEAMPAHILIANGEKANNAATRDILRAKTIKNVL